MLRIGRNRRARTGRLIAVFRGLAACAAVGLGAVRAGGQPKPSDPPSRPDAARRIVRVFDFEEQKSNPFAWPRHWMRAQDGLRGRTEKGSEIAFKRPGFPSWNLAELDYKSPAFAGSGSVKLPTVGGSTALRLEPGVVPVFADADYLVSARVRTTGLVGARARMSAVFLDSKLKPIENSRVASELIVSEDEWAPAEIELHGRTGDAAFLEIELALLQPQQQDGVIPEFRPSPQDYSGAAWFDDVAVAQLPRIELTSVAPGGVFVAPQKPELSLDIRDLTGEELTAQITVIDSRGTVVDRVTREIGSGKAHESWAPAVTRFGWYRAALGVFNKDALVGKAHADFLWLDADPIGTGATRRLTEDRRRFGVVIDPAPTDGRAEAVLRRIGCGSVVIPAWAAGVTKETAKVFARDLAAGIDPFLEHDQTVTLILPRMPEDLAAITRLDPDDVWRVLAGDRAIWGPFLDPVMERFGQRVRRWQIGGVGDRRAMMSRALAADMTGATAALSTLVPSPVLCVPWRTVQDLPSAAGSAGKARVSVLVERDTAAGEITKRVESWRAANGAGGGASELEFVFESAPDDLYGFGPGLVDLARRTVEVWGADRAGPVVVGASADSHRPSLGAVLLTPWTLGGKEHTDIEPRPELGVWSTLARHLSERRVVGEFPVGQGLKCFILAPAPGTPEDTPGAMVAWNESALGDDAVLRAYVGQGPVTVVDLFGNTSAAEPDDAMPRRARAGQEETERVAPRRPGIRVPLTTEPVFIEGVDARLVKFLSSVRIDPPLLKPTNETHEHAIVFDNPWNVPLDVKAFVASPGGYETADGTRDRRWRITPRAGRAIVPPGGQGRIPMTVAFAASEEAGIKEFVLDLEVTGDRDYGSIRTTATVELGLPEISLELAALHQGADVVVEARITNRGTHAMDLDLTATAPDQPRGKAPVSQLPPGKQAIRRFPYSKGFEGMKGKRVSVAVLEPETGARIVRSVVVE